MASCLLQQRTLSTSLLSLRHRHLWGFSATFLLAQFCYTTVKTSTSFTIIVKFYFIKYRVPCIKCFRTLSARKLLCNSFQSIRILHFIRSIRWLIHALVIPIHSYLLPSLYIGMNILRVLIMV
jgi:hypothetical protein